MRKVLIISLFLVAAPAAFAAEHEAAEKPSNGAPGNNVEMPVLIAPVLVDGKLSGYFYISSHATATSGASAIAIREKLAFIQDAFVRDVNARPMLVTDASQIDRAQLGNRLTEAARRIVGGGKITGIVFGDGAKDIGIKFSSLHPEATPSDVPFEDMEPVAEAKPAAKPPAHH